MKTFLLLSLTVAIGIICVIALNHQINVGIERGVKSGIRKVVEKQVDAVLFAPTSEATNNMPPGWKLQTDGKEWRWVDSNGRSWLPLPTRKRAVENAWEHYNYKPPQWRDTE